MLSIHHYFGFKLGDEEVYRLIKQTGFESTALWWGNRNYINYASHPDIARKAGLHIEYIHAPYSLINNIWTDSLEGDDIEQLLLSCIEDCALHELPIMVMHISSGDTPPPYNELGLDRIKRITEKAEQKNIRIALENLRRVDYLAYVLGNIDSQKVGFCYDSGHRNWRAPDVDLLGLYGARLMALHLHDNDGTFDQHLLPFDGDINWKETMTQIASTGFKGAVSLEVGNAGYKHLSPVEFLQISFERANKLLAIYQNIPRKPLKLELT